jgi:hypothetical protein
MWIVKWQGKTNKTNIATTTTTITTTQQQQQPLEKKQETKYCEN